MTSSSNVSTSIGSIYNNVQVPLFEGENYDIWAVKMETLFTSLDVLELVKEGYEELAATTEATVTQREELKKKKITDVGVLGMIQIGVSIAKFPRIIRAKPVKQAWEILQQEEI